MEFSLLYTASKLLKWFPFAGTLPNNTKHHYICILIKNISAVQSYQQTYQVGQVLSASHFTELFHCVKGNTVPRHQPASLCKDQEQTT